MSETEGISSGLEPMTDVTPVPRAPSDGPGRFAACIGCTSIAGGIAPVEATWPILSLVAKTFHSISLMHRHTFLFEVSFPEADLLG